MIIRIILFLAINFFGLWLGSQFTDPGVSSTWYNSLNKAPWTPPGWVFGAAWTLIMICFSIYLAYVWSVEKKSSTFLILFILAFIFNVTWNPVFFHFQQTQIALVIIISLLVMIGIYFFRYWHSLQLKSLLIFPYLVWLLIATSLNAYIVFMN